MDLTRDDIAAMKEKDRDAVLVDFTQILDENKAQLKLLESIPTHSFHKLGNIFNGLKSRRWSSELWISTEAVQLSILMPVLIALKREARRIHTGTYSLNPLLSISVVSYRSPTVMISI